LQGRGRWKRMNQQLLDYFKIPTIEQINSKKDPNEQDKLFLRRWMLSMELFVEEAMGVNKNTRPDLFITQNQRDAMKILTGLVVARLKKNYGVDIDEEEKSYLKKFGLSIRSGHDEGKGTLASWAILWFLACFPNCKIPCTAPTEDQLKRILWSEVSKWLDHRDVNGNYACKVRDWYGVQGDMIYHIGGEKKRWFAIPRTASPNQSRDSQAETLAGFNEEFKLVVVDEASGVPEAVFNPLEGGLGGMVNIILMIWNPTRATGYAHDSHFGKGKKQYVRLHWDCENSELVSKQHIENMEEKHGRESNTYRIRVRGMPPLSDTDSVIPLNWVEDCMKTDIEPILDYPVKIGVDCAYMGNNEIVICARRGHYVYPLKTFDKLDTIRTTAWVMAKAKEYGADEIYIDATGVGVGVYDQVNELFKKRGHCFPVVSKSVAMDPKEFYSVRDEMWWRMREYFEKKIIKIPDDDMLRDQIAAPRNTPDTRGRKKVESKEQLKARGHVSPDRADALSLTFCYEDDIFDLPDTGKVKYSGVEEFLDQELSHTDGSWMGA